QRVPRDPTGPVPRARSGRRGLRDRIPDLDPRDEEEAAHRRDSHDRGGPDRGGEHRLLDPDRAQGAEGAPPGDLDRAELRGVGRMSPQGPAGALGTEPSRILVFRIGQLGDTIIALPAVHAVREPFPRASLTLLCDRQVGRSFVLAPDLLKGSGLFDAFIVYGFDPSARSRRFLRPLRTLALLARLRAGRFDTIVYLAPSNRGRVYVERDRRVFRLAGMRTFIGFEGFVEPPPKVPDVPLPPALHEADRLLGRLAASGIPVPAHGEGDMDLHLGAAERESLDA